MTKQGINPPGENPPPDSRRSSFIGRFLGNRINPPGENPPPDSRRSSFIGNRINPLGENPPRDSRDLSSVRSSATEISNPVLTWIDENHIKYIAPDGTTQVLDANIEPKIPFQFSYSTSKEGITRIISPDWKHIAIITPEGLAIVNKTDRSIERIYTGTKPVKGVTWSRDNQSVSFQT